MQDFFAFDLDGTVTAVETLPLLAAELNLSREMTLLTELTLNGTIPFDESFRIRVSLLKDVPTKKIREIMAAVPLNENIAAFIRAEKENCAVITGNLDLWTEPLAARIGCRFLASVGAYDENGRIVIKKIIDKGTAIATLRQKNRRIIAVGDGAGDIPMFAAADMAVAYAGVHAPAKNVLDAADFTANDGEELCSLLQRLKKMPPTAYKK